MASFDPDYLLQAYVGKLIDKRKREFQNARVAQKWTPGNPLKLLLAGYVGSRNTGADVRVEEMIRQFRHILGDENLAMSILTMNPEKTHGYFDQVKQVLLPDIFPNFLYKETAKYDGVVACEGSMFKSKFSDALSIMMGGSLGFANAERKLSVGYGAEAGKMTPHLSHFIEKYCHDSYVVCRNNQSRNVLENLDIRTTGGTDTAWTFEPTPLDRGHHFLTQHGWDGKTPVLAIAPINPFWWPVKPRLGKAFVRLFNRSYLKDTHYKSIYFHDYSASNHQKYQTYLEALTIGFKEFAAREKVFPILIAMEQLDTRACQDLQKRLPVPAPIFSSQEWNMYDMVSVLRNSTYMVSSRFHAIVTSMPGLVASCGITMDERIANLLKDRGHEHLLMEVDQKDLADKLVMAMFDLRENKEKIQQQIAQNIPKQMKLMAQMGQDFLAELKRLHPDFPVRAMTPHWENYLPKMPKKVAALMEIYG